MKFQTLIIEEFNLMFAEMEKVLDGLDTDDLHQRPAPGANPIGWLCWHTIRSCDRFLGDVVTGHQRWIYEDWHTKFHRPPDYNDTGYGHTAAQVDLLRIPSVKTLEDYGREVKAQLMDYLEKLTEKELDRKAPNSVKPGTTRPVSERLVGLLNNTQHVGQAGYVRGIIKGHGWYGR